MPNEVQVKLHKGNLWQGTFIINEFKSVSNWTWTSPRYLCGAVAFEVHVKTYNTKGNDSYGLPTSQLFHTIFGKFIKIFQDDDLTYTFKVKQNNASKDVIQNFSTQDFYYEIFNLVFSTTQEFSFDLDVMCDIVTGKSTFASLFDDAELTDFKLCGKDCSVSVHSPILAAISPVMRAMLSGNWKEKSEGQVDIADTSKKTLEDLKEYIYLDKLPEEGIEELIVFGAFYEMSDLIQKCTVKIMNNLNAGNILAMLELAGQCKLTKLLYGILISINNSHVCSISMSNLCNAMKNMGKRNGKDSESDEIDSDD